MSPQPHRPPGIHVSAPMFVLRRSFGPLQHGVLGVARSAGRLGIPVYAARMGRHESATRSRYIRGGFVLPADASDEQWLDALLELGAEIGTSVLLSLDDEAAVFTDDHKRALSERFITFTQPAGVHRQLSSKREMSELCARLGVPTPGSSIAATEEQAVDLASAYGYPVVLKRAEAWLPPRDPGVPSVLLAHDASEVIGGYRRMDSPVRPQVMVQDYIPGGSDTIWMFNGYFNSRSECLCAFTGRKLRQRGPRTGPTTLGVCVWNEAISESAKTLLAGLGYRGIVDMGFRYDERDGRYKLLDVNPRLGSSFRLFVGANGLDVVRAAYLDLTGQPVQASRAPDGRKWLVEPYDLVTSLQLAGEGQLGLAEWRGSLSGVQEGAWWARDDPMPFVSMCASLPEQAGGYRVRRRAGRCNDGASQDVVDHFFDSAAGYWSDVYGAGDLQGLVYRERMEAALRWIAQIGLPAGAAVLEVGCGSGLLSTELARRGLSVTATDSSAEMVKVAQLHANENQTGRPVRVVLCDARQLPFEDDAFELVVALGLLPWLPDAETALGEMTRVLCPGGWLVATADNRARLNFLSEPRENVLLAPLKLARRAIRQALDGDAPSAASYLHLPGRVDRMLARTGTQPVRRTTVGYGPFTFLGRSVLRDSAGRAVHARLQALSHERAPALRRVGWHYLVAARKPER